MDAVGDRPSPVVYVDNSVLGRLTDLPSRGIVAEQTAIWQLVAAIQIGRLRLLSSRILVTEVLSAPPEAQRPALDVLDLAWASVLVKPTQALAQRLQGIGFQTADALHLAAAYTGGADYAISCDRDHWIRRAARVAALLGPGPQIVTPEEAVRRVGL